MPPSDDKTPRVPLGPIGRYVIGNIQYLRRIRGLTYREMSDRLAQIGRPIPTLGLSRIEKGTRRVDVDDLVALAVVLEASPVELLQPRKDDIAEDGTALVAENLRMPARHASEWMADLMLLPPGDTITWPRAVTAKRVRESEMADMRRRIEQLESLLSRRDSEPHRDEPR